MALTDSTRPSDVALNTDLYELTMAQGYWESGMMEGEGCFNVFFRDAPFDGGYAIACGMGQIAELVENFVYDDESIAYLASIQAPGGGAMFKQGFLDYLRDFRMRTKTARVVHAAEGHPVSDFGLRRAQGPDGGLAVARASYIGGASSTSNVLAGKIYGIPVFGTHAHSWVMSFPTEIDAFRAFAASSPKNCVLLLDTYDVRQGIKNAIIVAKEMEERGERLAAVRLDSGDLARLSKMAREAFDAAGLPYVKISVSNDLDEYTIQSLFAQGAPIDSFGVGTKLATCDPQPSLGGVYKLSATRMKPTDPWDPVIKLSEQAYKRTIPGVQHIRRYYDAAGVPVGDMIVDDSVDTGDTTSMVNVLDELTTYDLSEATSAEIMVPLVADGHRVGEHESIETAKARCREAFMRLDPATKRFLNPQTYPVGLERGLARLRNELALEEAKGSGRRSRN